MKNYAGILSRLHNTPLLMAEDKLKVITEAVTLPLLIGAADSIDRVPGTAHNTMEELISYYGSEGRKIGVISVFDSLVSKEASAGSGMTSYQRISSAIDTAISQNITDLGFFIDSPGGEVSVFGLTDKIRSLKERGINTFAFCDSACSAAYAIAAATDKIYISPTASVGSIGALLVHAETSKADAEKGITYTIIRSKDKKALGDSHTPINDTVMSAFTSIVATLDTVFNNDVVKSRPALSIEAIKALEGGVVLGEAAIAANLADAVVPTLEAAFTDFRKSFPQTKKSKKETTMSDSELEIKLAELQQKLTSMEAEFETKLAAALQEENERVKTVLETAKTLHLPIDTAIKYCDSKYSAELATEIMTDLAEIASEKSSLETSQGNVATALEEPKTSLRAAYKAATNI